MDSALYYNILSYFQNPPPPDRVCTCGVQPSGAMVYECANCKAWRLKHTPMSHGRSSNGPAGDSYEQCMQKLDQYRDELDALVQERDTYPSTSDPIRQQICAEIGVIRQRIKRIEERKICRAS